MTGKFVVAVFLCAAALSAQSAPAADSWKPLEFLIGAWEAKAQGGSAKAASSGTYSFELELRNHVLARHSMNAECKGPADYDCAHGDLLYIYREGPDGSYKAIYFDNEGHVIHYGVSTPAPATAVLLSDPSQPGPRFRLVYERKGTTMYGKFQVSAPGATEFKSYLEWSGEKK